MKRDKDIPKDLKVPSPLSCSECLENGDHRIHFAFSQEDYPHGDWSWNIMDHDKKSRFRWPASFDSKNEAKSHINVIIEQATEKKDFIV